MNRRDFLKAAGMGSLALVAFSLIQPLSLNSPGDALPGDSIVNWDGKLFKGMRNGQILASEDGGGTWHACANFGEQHGVKNLSVRNNQLWAEISLPGASFKLASRNGRVWRTVA